MHFWGEYCHHQPFFWDWSERVPSWLSDHLLRRLDEIEGYKANLEVDAFSFEYLQERHPDLLDRLKQYVASGKLEIVDGTYVQPYSLLQSGESCIRHFVYGQQAMKRIMGRYVKTYHKQEPLFFAQLPQILCKAGYDHAILRLHITHYGSCPVVELERMLWAAPDGSAIDTVPDYLDAENKYNLAQVMEDLPAYQMRCEQFGMESMFVTTGLDISHDMDYLSGFKVKKAESMSPDEVVFFKEEWLQSGVSDDRLEEIMDEGFKFVNLSEYFAREAPCEERVMPNHDDFVLSYKAGQLGDGMLRRGKRTEDLIYDAEVLASMVRMSGGPTLLDESGQKQMWRTLLMGQNHDLHACPTSYSYSVAASPHNTFFELAASSESIAEQTIDDSLGYFCANVNCLDKDSGDSVALVVFNQLLRPRRSIVVSNVTLARGFARVLCVKDGAGNELPVDVVIGQTYDDGSILRAEVSFVADLPAMGYGVYYVARAEEAARPSSGEARSCRCLESDSLKIVFGDNGLIESVVEKESGFEYLDTKHYQGNELTVDFVDGLVESKGNATKICLSRGAVSSTLTAEGGYVGRVPYTMKYRLWHDLGRLDCETTLDFDAGLCTKSMYDEFSKFRVTFNPGFSGELFVDEPFLVRCSSREVALGYNFASYTDGQRCVTLVNNGNIGYFQDAERNTRLSLILAFGDDGYFYGALLLSGVHTFRYSLFFDKGKWRPSRSVQQGLDVSHPFYARQTVPRDGSLLSSCSFLGSDRDNVVVSACYPYQKGVCLRLWETDGQATEAPLALCGKTEIEAETDLLGRTITKLGGDAVVKLGPREFKTLYIPV